MPKTIDFRDLCLGCVPEHMTVQLHLMKGEKGQRMSDMNC